MTLKPILKRFYPGRFSLRHMGLDAVLLLISLYGSLWLRLGTENLHQHLSVLNALAIGFVLIRLLVFLSLGVYQILWRYISTHDATRLTAAVLASVPLMMSLTYMFPEWYLPRSFFVIDAFVATALLGGVRLLRRRLYERHMQPSALSAKLGKLIIYGAGQNGRLLAQRMLSDPARDRELMGFIDDSRVMTGKYIANLPVLGSKDDLESVVSQSGCTEVVVAISAPPPELMRDLVLLGRKLGVRIGRIAHFDEGLRNEALYQSVELKDLLHRPSQQIDVTSVKKLIEGKVILVTGAGGSIGGELSRQIARFSPAKLLLLDHSELALYEIDRELRPSTQNFEHVVPLLLDIKDLDSLRAVFKTHGPEIVFHAAAYKHVHLVEANVAPSVLNNVVGTENLLKLSEEYKVARFVMVSTDKAVNPVGAMGATKKVCELLTSATGRRLGARFSSVRFGNVLGSSGSLIPLLTKQIEEGGPVTLTHPDMTRYFMLIPEAVGLVLMSATLSEPGDVNVLKMGEPVKILDLAKSLMAILGKHEDEVGIAFTGVRPGEKMFEELYLRGDELTTRHPDILTVPGIDQVDGGWLAPEIRKLIKMAENSEPETLRLLLNLANPKQNGERHLEGNVQ